MEGIGDDSKRTWKPSAIALWAVNAILIRMFLINVQDLNLDPKSEKFMLTTRNRVEKRKWFVDLLVRIYVNDTLCNTYMDLGGGPTHVSPGV